LRIPTQRVGTRIGFVPPADTIRKEPNSYKQGWASI
jgi:hypothetical protein